MRGLGGTVEAFYFAFGQSDAYVIADLPDNVSAAAVASAVGASGALSNYRDRGAAHSRRDRRSGEEGSELPAAGGRSGQ